MDNNTTPPILIRRYPNRRFYDTSRSTHITLDELRQYVIKGKDVRVEDSKSNEDITEKVLTHILLEFSPEKLRAFPKALLYALVQENDRLVQEFIRHHFTEGFAAFLASEKKFEEYFLGEQMENPFGLPPTRAANGSAKPDSNLIDEVEALRQEMQRMREKLEEQAG